MAQPIEIAYYNSIVLAGSANVSDNDHGKYHIEESRIKGGFNETSMDYGVKAYTTDDEYAPRRRSNAMIYSGIYNSKTKVNKTNEFPIGAAITRAVDISHGSIQKLHAEDTNLNIFQENKVSAALIDKDAIFTAEGGSLTVSGSKVIGQVRAYTGKFGISTNPESFAHYAGTKYFADANRGTIMKLSNQGLFPISSFGMKDFFRDNLRLITNDGKIFGMYDEVKNQYVLSIQEATNSLNHGKISKGNIDHTTETASGSLTSLASQYVTLSFSDRTNGWVSYYTYKPSFGTSIQNQYFTFNGQSIYKHYDDNAEYNKFYDATYKDPSYVKLVQNDMPSTIKTFFTINYEGSTGWFMDSMAAESVNREGYTTSSVPEEAYKIPKKGVTIVDETGASMNVGFELKESKYYKELKQKLPFVYSNYTSGFNDNTLNTTTGIKGYHANIELQYYEPFQDTTESKAELFAVSNDVSI